MPTGIGGGSSTGGNDIRAGGAYVEIYGKNKLTGQLDGIKASAKSQIKGVTGILGGFALADVVKTGFDAAISMHRLNAEMEDGARISARLEAAQAKLRDRIFEKVGGKMSQPVEVIPDSAGRLKFLEQQLVQAQTNLQGVGRDADKAKEKLNELYGGKNLVIEQLPFASKGLETDRADAKNQLDDLNKRRAALQGLTADLREQIAAQKAAPGPFTQWMTAVEDVEKSLKVQYDTLGMTAEEALLYKLRMDAVAKSVKDIEGSLANARGLVDDIANKKLFQDTKKGFEDFDKQLERDLRMAGMTPEQQKVFQRTEKVDELLKGKFPGLAKENEANRKGMLAMFADLDRIQEIQAGKMPNFGGLSTLTSGGFNGTNATAASFNRDLANKQDTTNDWLREIFGKLDNLKPVNWK